MIPHFNAAPWKYLDGLGDGDHFYYHGVELVKLGEEQGGILCITANLLGESFFDMDTPPSWDTSAVRVQLHRKIWPMINEDDLLPMTLDLTPVTLDLSQRGAENTTKDTIGILSLEQYKKYKSVMPKYDKTIWTCSPYCYHHHGFCVVSSGGHVYVSLPYYSYGCVPVLLFKKEKENTILDADILFNM